MALTKNVNTNGRAIQKNLGANTIIKIRKRIAKKKYSQNLFGDLAASITL